MTRIEDALRKLEEQRRSPIPDTGMRRPASADHALGVLKPFAFETANRLTLDVAALRRWGPVAMLLDDERAKREYGQIKRPIINVALGRNADATRDGNVVVVTSAVAGDGKSLTTFNLAISIAREKDLAVLLIDADLAKPDLSRALGLAGALGLTDLIADEALQLRDVLWQTSVDGLYFIPAGRERSNATELLGSQRMKRIVGMLGRDLPQAIVLIDSSPLLLTNESPVLVSLGGQTVLVVRANETPRSLVSEAIGRLDSTKPVGLVLNGASGDSVPYYTGSFDGSGARESNVKAAEIAPKETAEEGVGKR
jgi:exopolysaccharide/PEP-CTERM locus tyrosine autokinase